jgi:hypothetical protein
MARAETKIELMWGVLDMADTAFRFVSASRLGKMNPDSKLLYLAVAAAAAIALTINHLRGISKIIDLRYVADHGYGRNWTVKASRTSSNRSAVHTGSATKLNNAEIAEQARSSGIDPRVVRDVENGKLGRTASRAVEGLCVILPWFLICLLAVLERESEECTADDGVTRGTSDTSQVLTMAVASSAMSLGWRLQSVYNLLLHLSRKVTTSSILQSLYEPVPGNVRSATGASTDPDSAAAVLAAHSELLAKFNGDSPDFVVVSMTANHDIDAALGFLQSLSPTTVFVGGTTSCGVMKDGEAVNKNDTVVGLFGVIDPEGIYVSGCAEYGDETPGDVAERLAKDCLARKVGEPPKQESGAPKQESGVKVSSASSSMRFSGKLGSGSGGGKIHPLADLPPAFVYFASTPGNEDAALLSVAGVVGQSVPVVGGSAADNDVTGKWKCYAASPGRGAATASNGVAVCVAWPSVRVEAALFSGYGPTQHKGVITKINGVREVAEIDGRKAVEVYKEWVGADGGDMTQALAGGGDDEVNVLGPSSYYPMGQLYGTDSFGDSYYRIMHPHLIKNSAKSFTLFSDVEVGQEIILMTGTKENLINRISHCARHISRSSKFDMGEIVGAAVIFCGGCMMAVKDDMRVASQRLNEALRRAPHMAAHTFGEQGKFPNGRSHHGNLMFSVMVFSNRRVVDKVVNLDTGKTLAQNDAEYSDLVVQGLIQAPGAQGLMGRVGGGRRGSME